MIIKLKFKDTDKYFIYTIKWDVRKIEINNFHYKISPSTSITKFYLWPEHLLPIFTLGNGCFITWLWVEISKKYGKFALGSTNVNFWNAANICNAIGGRMFSEADAGCVGAGSAETGVSRICSVNGWIPDEANPGSVDENGNIQGCTFSEKLCELYHLGKFNKTSWIDNAWKEGSGCVATRMVFPGGFSLYQTRNKDAYAPFCILN